MKVIWPVSGKKGKKGRGLSDLSASTAFSDSFILKFSVGRSVS